jgi:hypothetical protein
MTFDYTSMASVVTDQLAQFGMPMALRRVTAGTYDPVTGTTAGGTSSDIACTGLTTKISNEYAKAFAVEANDRMAILDGKVQPLMTDLLVIASVPWQIVRIDPVQPTTIPLAYKCQIRR